MSIIFFNDEFDIEQRDNSVGGFRVESVLSLGKIGDLSNVDLTGTSPALGNNHFLVYNGTSFVHEQPSDALISLGVTSTAAELNKLDGATVTTTEINYLDITTLGTSEASKVLTVNASGDLIVPDSDKFQFGAGLDMTLYHDGTNSYITNQTGALKIATETSGIAVNIGHGTSEVTIGDNLTVTGNLTVNGTTTTVNSVTQTVDDPVLTLGGDTAPGSDDNKDRGVEFRWHNGSAAKVGFFGYDDSTSKFTFIPDATNSSEVFSGTAGNVAFGAGEFAGDLTVDTSVLKVDSTNNRVGIGTATPSKVLHVVDTAADAEIARFQGGDGNIGIQGGAKITFSRNGNNNLTCTDAAGALVFETGGSGNNRLTISNAGVSTFTNNVVLDNAKSLVLSELDSNGSNTVSIKAPNAVTSDVTLTLPDGAGTNGQALTTNGSGVLSWTTISSGSTTLSSLTDTDISSASAGHILIHDGSNSFDNKALSGDATISAAGVLTIAAEAVEGSMLNDNVISGQAEMTGDVADTDELLVSDAGTIKRADFSVVRDAVYNDISGDATVAAGGALTIAANAVHDSMLNDDVATGLAGDGLAASSGVLSVGVDDSSIETNSDALRVKAAGITNAMLAGSISNDKLAGSIADSKLNTISTAGKVALSSLEIDGGTDIGAALVDADLIIVDDGAGGTNRKAALSRVKTYVGASAGAFSIDNLDLDGGTDIGADLVDADLVLVDDGAGGTNRKSTLTRVKKYIYSAMSGDATASDAGALTIAANSVEGSMLNNNVISGQTEMTGDVADADELLISDGGTIKRADFSVVRDAIFNDISGDATVAAGGALTIANDSVQKAMVNSDVVTGQTELSSKDDNGNDAILVWDNSASSLKKMTLNTLLSGTGSSGNLSNIVEDTTPQLGGSLDVNGQDIVSVSNGNITLTPNGSGVVRIDGTSGIDMQSGSISVKNSGSVSNIKLYCEVGNAHYTQLQSAAHGSYSGNITLTLPTSTGTLVGTGDSGTVTNGMLAGSITASKMNNAIFADLETLGAPASDGQFIVATGSGAFAYESANTARTSLGLGTGNSPEFTSLTLTGQAGSLAMNSQKITGLATPTSDGDAATKAYVDSVAQGLSAKDSVRAATTENKTLASSFSNGKSIDGITLATGDRVLIKNQTSGAENGIYTVNASGAPTRAVDFDANAEVAKGAFVFVEEGTVNADSGFVLTTDGSITLGTTSLTFTQFSGAGQITAGDALTKSGNTLNVKVDDSSIEVNSNELKVKASGITSAMLAGAIANSKLNQLTTANKVALSSLDLDGGTDIGADLVDADLIVVDDGAGGTNRKAALSRVKKYVYSAMSGDATASDAGVLTIANNAIETAMVHSNVITGQDAKNSTVNGSDLVLIADSEDSNNLKKMTRTNFVAGLAAGSVAADDISTGDAAVTITTSSGDTNIKSAAGDVLIEAENNAKKVTIKGDHESSTAIHLDGNANAASIVDIDAGVLDIDATAGITMDGTTLSIDGTDDSNLTVTGSAKDLDIAVAGGGTQELRITSAGTGASALHLNASAGGINIDSADMIDIDAADEITIDTTSADGHIAITSAHTAGDAILISANADAGSILNVDAGIMDVDVQGTYTLDATGISLDSDAASNFSTSSGALTLSGAGGVDINGGLGSTGVTISATGAISADGRIVTDDTTNATSTTDGSIQTDGGLSVALDAVIGDDLLLKSDNSVLHFGADSEVTLTHDPDVGLMLKNTETGDDKPVRLTLISGESELSNGEVVGSIDFKATDTNGFTGVLSSIESVTQSTFSSTSKNQTKLSFKTSTGGNAATEVMSINHQGYLSVYGGLGVDGDTSTFSSANSTDPLVIIKNTTNDANGARLRFVKDKGAAGADNDVAGLIEFYADDDNQDQVKFAEIKAQVADATNGEEGGKLTLSVAEHDGTLTQGLLISDGSKDGEVDVTIGAGNDSVVTIPGALSVGHQSAEHHIQGPVLFDSILNIFSSGLFNDYPVVQIKNTHSGANGGKLQFIQDKGAAGADGDKLGSIEFRGDDAGQNITAFASIVAEISEADDTDEAGKLSLFVGESDGTTTSLTAGLVIEGEHATDGEVDVTIAAGTGSTTTVAGNLSVSGTSIIPTSADGASLGTASSEWSDLYLALGGQVLFGNNQKVTITHHENKGLILKNGNVGDDNPFVLTLQTGETDIAVDDVIGTINFQAPDEGTGTDAILVCAGIDAVSEGDFSASNNATKLSFKTGASEAASEKMSLSSGGNLTVLGDIILDDGGSLKEAGGTAAITFDGSGHVTKIGQDSPSNNEVLTWDGSKAVWAAASGGGSTAADDISTGDAAVTIATSSGNITIDAQGSDTDIIFKGTDGSTDTTFLTLDGSDAGTATFNHDIKLPTNGAQITMGSSDDVKITHSSNSGLIITMDGDGDGSYDPTIEVKSDHTDAYGPRLILKHAGSDGATDTIYKLSGEASNGSGTNKIYTSINSRKVTHSNGSEDGKIVFHTISNGSLTQALNLDGSAGGTASFYNDIILASDDSIVKFGANSDVTLTHVHNKGLLLETGTQADAPTFELKNAHGGNSGPSIILNKNGASVADDDVIGNIDFVSEDDASNVHTFAKIQSQISDASSGAEGGKLLLQVAEHDGTLTSGLILADGDADGEIDATIGAGSSSVTTVAGKLSLGGVTYEFPTSDGSSNQVLKTDGSGNLDWVAQSGSGGGFTYSAITSTTTAQVEYHYSVNTSGGAVTLNLPARSGITAGKEIRVKLATAGNDLTIDANSTETIDGSETLVLNVANQSVTLVAGSATNWEIV
tara:strand:+ start:850 stop:9234 length:8385 start_codon:yes stop_codon:yes gene_type:complete